jgi:undecaprenyl diphosphate synthase
VSEAEFKIPKHVAIIMDGNNRWAKGKLLGGISGHKAGADAVRRTVKACAKQGVKVLTLYAFSSENWKRPKEEVSGLMDLFMWALNKEVKKLHKNNIRLQIIGDRKGFSEKIQKGIEEAEALTKDNTHMTVVVAANYGGRWDIANGAKQLALKVAAGELDADDIDEFKLHEEISLAEHPEPDLCIRTANEQRISNFLLWQFAYSEFYYTPVLWPDFGENELVDAIDAFNGRERRFGGR